MEQVEVLMEFIDKETKERYRKGQIIELSTERIEEVNGTNLGKLVQALPNTGGDVPDHGPDLEEIKTGITGLESEISDVKTGITGLESEISDVKTGITGLESEISDVKTTVSSVDGKVDTIVDNTDPGSPE